MYEKHDIEEMLKNHLKRLAQLKELKSKIEKNEIQLKYDGKKMEMSVDEKIESMALKSTDYSKISTGKTNKKSTPTENIALNYRDDLTYIHKVDKIKLINEIKDYKRKAEPLEDFTGKVERMLGALNKEQKLVIESYYMYEPKWNYVSRTYIDVYNEPRTINQLKNIRDIALKIMLEVINI